MDTSAINLPSFAKINWSLRILGKRSDGYHEVETVLQTISLHDELRFAASESDEIVLECDDPSIPVDGTNLVIRAAESLRRRYGIRSGARISLRKVIPAKGGLGGASSNAAVTLVGLSRLWQLEPVAEDLWTTAASLGADAPFFLLGGRAEATGIGTALRALPDGQVRHLLIVTPNASVSTAEAYRALNAPALTSERSETILAVSHKTSVFNDSFLWDVDKELANDFESVIFDREPEIERAKSSLLRSGARAALLAGSGSSVFGIFDDLQAQKRASEVIQIEAGWRVFPCVTMSRNEYSRVLGLTETLRSF